MEVGGRATEVGPQGCVWVFGMRRQQQRLQIVSVGRAGVAQHTLGCSSSFRSGGCGRRCNGCSGWHQIMTVVLQVQAVRAAGVGAARGTPEAAPRY